MRCHVRRQTAADLGVVELHKHQGVRAGRLSHLHFGTNARRAITLARCQHDLLRAQAQDHIAVFQPGVIHAQRQLATGLAAVEHRHQITVLAF